MSEAPSLTVEQVREALAYNPDTGAFTWRFRRSMPTEWNSRWAGKPAGGVDLRGYVNINLHGRLHKAHRLAWLLTNGRWPEGDIDHVNRVRSDNRIANLRECSRSENMQNQGGRPNPTGLAGVSYCRDTGRWRAKIGTAGQQFHLGRFDTPEAAHAAYRRAKGKLHTFHPIVEAGRS